MEHLRLIATDPLDVNHRIHTVTTNIIDPLFVTTQKKGVRGFSLSKDTLKREQSHRECTNVVTSKTVTADRKSKGKKERHIDDIIVMDIGLHKERYKYKDQQIDILCRSLTPYPSNLGKGVRESFLKLIENDHGPLTPIDV